MLSPQLDLYRHLAPHMQDKRVLEVGFGTGFGTLQFMGYARDITAIEPDIDAVDFAVRCLNPLAIEWTHGNILKPVWARGRRWDAVVMIEVLEHIGTWRMALQHVCNLLTDDGALYISARNANADLRKNDLHEREWRAQEFRDGMAEFFEFVQLFDYTLEEPMGTDTRQTPLVAIASYPKRTIEYGRQKKEVGSNQEHEARV
ncbi:MAG: class I SAM-dependent methyltransferase [Anaerolineales bacterium]